MDNTGLERLVERFIQETDLKFSVVETKMDRVDAKLDRTNKRLEDLTRFKVEMVASAKLVSIVVSLVFSVGTVILSAGVAWAFTKWG